MKILVVEDEQKVASFLKDGLEEQGYEVTVAYDGSMGDRLSNNVAFDIILMDVVLPGINGIQLCQLVKSRSPQTPVLMLTALGTTDDKVEGFEAGADDYLVKPFAFKELLARIKALTKRNVGAAVEKSTLLRVADLQLDLDKKVAVRAGTSISLTAKEFSLLEFFMRNKGRVLSRAEIAEKVWDVTFDTGTNVVEVYVNILRKKIDKNFPTKLIHTRIGMGYMFQEGT